jgi:hypothetical protein
LRQRCIFHKFKNLASALKLAQGSDSQAKKKFSTAFLRSASRIWQAGVAIGRIAALLRI